ncbi:DNA-binding protein [Candidatus Beckwithbacteria bacterium]|nr:DNA-binding protein [Candidatus Beckwithbacteria bacterium]
MQSKQINKTNYLIRIQRGEKIIETLKTFCKEKKIEGGFFYGLGAVDWVELAHYDVVKQKYSSLSFEKAYEVSNLTGSIGVEQDLIIHAHMTLADNQMQALAGHLIDARVSGTAEIYLQALPKLNKKFDKETGLKLFDFS